MLLIDGKAVLGIVVEAQLARDDRKRFTWPVYMAGLRARHECPVELLVMTHDRVVAAGAAASISLDLAETSFVRPRVLGPDLVPIITDIDQARRTPELAVLSALAHGNDEPNLASRVGTAALIAPLGLDPERATLYSQLIDGALSSAARAALETLMQTQDFPIKSEFARVQRASAKAESILRVLAKRHLAVSDAQRERILDCSDLDTLDRWLDTAVIATSTDELFI